MIPPLAKEAVARAVFTFLMVVGVGICVSALAWMGLSFMRRFFQ